MKYFEIYNIAELYDEHIKNSKKPYLPAKINFILSQNFKEILAIKKDIDKIREDIVKHYGVINSDGNYQIPSHYIEIAQKELNELSEMETEVKNTPISLREIENIEFTPGQFQAIEWMINNTSEAGS